MSTKRAQVGAASAALERLRARIRTVAVGERLTAGLAGTLVWLLGFGLLDYLLRLPGWLRAAVLIGGLVLLAVACRRTLWPALRLRPRLSTVALRLERSAFGQSNGLRGILASGIELAGKSEENEPESILALRRRAADEADARLLDARPWKLVDLSSLRRRAAWAGTVAAAAVAIAAISPSIAATALSRQILPLGDAAWPKRFAVADGTGAEVHPTGAAIPVRALVTSTTRELGQTPVAVVYRVIDASGATAYRREPLTPQRTMQSLEAGGLGEVYERLIDAPVTVSSDDDPAKLEYYFETPDDRTEPRRVLLVDQPSVAGVRLSVTPPEYASTTAGAFLSGEIDPDDAGRPRQLFGPILAGSRISLTANLSKPAQPVEGTPVSEIESGEPPAGLAVDNQGVTLGLSWTADRSARVTLGLRDRYGLESLEDTVLRVEVIADAAPTAAVTDPARDEAVLATAVVPIRAEGQDDVALAWVGLEYERAIVPGGDERSAGAEPEGDGSPVRIARTETADTRAEARATIDLATLGLRPGDALDVFALAADGFDRDGQTHGTARSDPRRLRIISESELIDELLGDLSSVRRAAMRLDQQQSEITQDLRAARDQNEPAPAELSRRQASVSESLAAAAETIDRVAERLDRNGLNDEGLSRVIDDAAEAADRGARASEQAVERLDEAQEQADERQTDEANEQAERASDEVRRALGDLAQALDRGEDSWAVRRSLESILREQEEVSRDTAAAGAQSVGRSAEDLTDEERSVLDEIAQRQLELAERAADLLDELDERAEQLEEQDPGQSSAMRSASRRGREQGVSQLLREAGRDVAQNRAAEAGRAQDEAQEQLEEMLQDLEQAERQRDAELQRALLSLVESIESLIRAQQSELERLARAEPDLAEGMTRLHRNTLSALNDANQDQAMAAVAMPLREAAAAQSAAIVLLREAEIDRDAAGEAESQSLAKLQTALEAAQQALDDAERREVGRKRDELKDAYRGALEAQVAITGETTALAERRLSRRERAELRSLGDREDAMRDQLDALRQTYPEITDTQMFSLAHDRLSDALGRAGDALRSGQADGLTPLDQASVERMLRGLIASLDPPEQGEQQDFDQGGGGGGGGGQNQGPQPLIPPIAELQMLRALQQDVYDRTRFAEQAGLREAASAQIGGEQQALAERAEALLREMQQQAPPTPTVPPEADE